MEEKTGYVELQAIVLAGGDGSRLFPLADEKHPKSLLTIANRPLLGFQLDLLEQAGFSEVIVVAVRTQSHLVSKYCKELYDGRISISVIVVEDLIGTTEVIRQIKHLIKTDFLIVSGDLVTDVEINYLADIHRTHDATLTCMLWKELQSNDVEKIKKQKMDSSFKHYVALDSAKQERLLYFRATADIDGDILNINRSILSRYPSIKVHTNLRDAHCYIFSRWIVDFIDDQVEISSIQNELIPFLTKNQFSRNSILLKFAASNPQGVAFSMTNSPWRGPPGSIQDPNRSSENDEDPIRCFAFVAPFDKFCRRSVTLNDYKEISFAALTRAYLTPQCDWDKRIRNNNRVSSSKEDNPRTQFGPNCIIDAFSKFGEQSSIKRCIIGKHCRIGNRVRLSGSILMDHVVIEDNCTIKDSVICDNSTVLHDCNLDNTFVGYDISIEAESIKRKEIVAGSDFRFE